MPPQNNIQLQAPLWTQTGITAKSPNNNVTPATNTLNKNQANVAPIKKNQPINQGSNSNSGSTAAAGNTGYVGNPQAFASYQGLQNIGTQGSPQVQAAQDELQRYKNAYANADAGVGMGGTDFNYAQGTEQNIANQYQQGLASRQSSLSSALTQQGQQAGALSSAGSLAANQQVSPGNFVIGGTTGQDVTGGSVNPFSGGQRIAGVAAGQADVGYGIAIQNARQNAASFLPAAHADPNFNASPVNAINGLAQAWANNTSSTITPGLQSQFNNILNQYASVLGGKDIVLNVVKSANASSIESLLQSLDAQAQIARHSNASMGQVTAPAPQTTPNAPAPQAQNQPQSFTRPNGQVVHLQQDGTYQ
jgi:hypothetical protein